MNREFDSVRMWNPDTNGVVTSRDVVWLKRLFYERKAADERIELVHHVNDEPEADDEEPKADDAADNNDKSDEEEEDFTSGGDDAEALESVAGEDSTRDATVTRSGRTVQPRTRLIESMAGTAVELQYLGQMAELDNDEIVAASIATDDVIASSMSMDIMDLLLVGAGIGGGFGDTSELNVMKYKEAMESKDGPAWKEEVGREKARFDKYNAVTPVPRRHIPDDAKVITSTWEMKRKTNGDHMGRLNAWGFEQIEEQHYVA